VAARIAALSQQLLPDPPRRVALRTALETLLTTRACCVSHFPPALSLAMPADDAELDRLSARRAQAADGLLPAAYVALEFGQGWEARGNRW